MSEESIGLMTPRHERWKEFIGKLKGIDDKDVQWDCTSTSERKLAREILASMGCAPCDIEQSLGFFSAFGGHCDCKIVFNVEREYLNTCGPVANYPTKRYVRESITRPRRSLKRRRMFYATRGHSRHGFGSFVLGIICGSLFKIVTRD